MALLKLIYQGTNTLILQKDSSTLVIDPHYTRPSALALLSKIKPDPGRIEARLDAQSIDQLEGVLLTHTHYDHALDAPEVICQVGGTLFGSESAANLARGCGLRPEQYCTASYGEVYQIGGFRVRFHPARHIPFPPPFGWLMPESGKISNPLRPPAWFWDYRPGDVFAIQVDRLIVFGSGGFIPGAYEGVDVDSAVLGIGGLETKSGSYLERLYEETVLAMGAQKVFITHWDNFFRSNWQKPKYLGLAKRTVNRLRKIGERHGQSVRLLPIGEAISVDMQE